MALPSNAAEEVAINPGGFAYRDMEFATLFPYEILGTIVNRSGRNYQRACFMMKLYSKDDRLLKTVDFCVSDLSDGQSKMFRTPGGTSPLGLKGYKILFSQGQ